MARPTPLRVTAGNTLPLKFTLSDENGDPVNLTSATITLSMRLRGATTNKIDDAAVAITAATTGTVTYSPTGTDFNTAGTYDMEIKVVDTNADVHHNFEMILVEVRDALNA